MDELARLLVLLALLGAAFAVAGGALAWFMEERRRLTRTLTQALEAAPEPMLAAPGRGAAIGFNLATAKVAAAWDRGGWHLVYDLGELLGAELIADRRVAARAMRGEARRPLDELSPPEDLVRLRFLFDDPHHPDFELDLWRPEDEGLRGRLDAETALQEANRWLARLDAILRRYPASRPAAVGPAVAAPAPPPSAQALGTSAAADVRPRAGAQPPPWEDDDDDDLDGPEAGDDHDRLDDDRDTP